MNHIFLVKRPDHAAWDEYISFVVCCNSTVEASLFHPDDESNYDECKKGWFCPSGYPSRSWPVNPTDLKVTVLGPAYQEIKKGVVCSSFNAG